MVLLSRAKSSAKLLQFLIQTVTPIQQSSLYSTKIAHEIQEKTSESSSTCSHRMEARTGEQIVRRKPREIRYQAKVANRVDLIGHVRGPVHFEDASGGNHFASIVISQLEKEENLLIPVVFEGDLAHVVYNHVKENNCVLVSGHLSTDPKRLPLSDSLVNLHVVADNLNFVEGYRREFLGKKSRVSFLGLEIDKAGNKQIEYEIKTADDDYDDDLTRQWNEALEYAKTKKCELSYVRSQLIADSEALEYAKTKKLGPSSVRSELIAESEALEYAKMKKLESSSVRSELIADSEAAKFDVFEDKLEKCGEENVRSLNLWRNLVENPLLWRDYRGHKSKGFFQKSFPDFKHKVSGDGLWMNTAPDWAISEFEKLEFDKGEDSWKNLVENPNNWWDYRDHKSKGLVKQNFPDFTHKVSGEGLWMVTAPDWVLSGFEKLEFCKGEDSWKNLVENPRDWWDNRLNKQFPKQYDFKHKERRGELLWVSEAPDWALTKLPPLQDR